MASFYSRVMFWAEIRFILASTAVSRFLSNFCLKTLCSFYWLSMTWSTTTMRYFQRREREWARMGQSSTTVLITVR